MAIDIELLRTIQKYYDYEELEEFRRLLTAHPEMLREENGTDLWMWKAARDGYLPFLECLVNLGMDVNESKDVITPEDPECSFTQIEGPILDAASNGHIQVVKWLLERGAKINYLINGKTRCLSLLRAATYDHLDIVKLLVEYGADISASFNGHTPLSQAEFCGNEEVVAYLRSIGMK